LIISTGSFSWGQLISLLTYVVDFVLSWKAYYILDELLIAGELQESSKKTIARLIAAQVCNVLSGSEILGSAVSSSRVLSDAILYI